MCDDAWPLLVGGVICLVGSANGRDPRLLNSDTYISTKFHEIFKGRQEWTRAGQNVPRFPAQLTLSPDKPIPGSTGGVKEKKTHSKKCTVDHNGRFISNVVHFNSAITIGEPY